MFSKKHNEHAHMVRYKARLVAKGFKKKFGVDLLREPLACGEHERHLSCAIGGGREWILG